MFDEVCKPTMQPHSRSNICYSKSCTDRNHEAIIFSFIWFLFSSTYFCHYTCHCSVSCLFSRLNNLWCWLIFFFFKISQVSNNIHLLQSISFHKLINFQSTRSSGSHSIFRSEEQ